MRFRYIVLLFGALIVAACLVDLPSLEDTIFYCQDDGQCSNDYLCDERYADDDPQGRGICLEVGGGPELL